MKQNLNPLIRNSIFFLLLILFSGNVFSQIDSAIIITAQKSEIQSAQLIPVVRDSLILKKIRWVPTFSIDKSRKYLQYYNEQFPSTIIQRFTGLPTAMQYEKVLIRKNEDWEFWFSMLLLAFLAFIRFVYIKDFDELKLTFKNWGLNQQTIRELGIGIPLGTVLLNLFSAMVFSFYIFLLIDKFEIILIEPSWLLMFFTALAVFAALLFRYLLLKIAEAIFPFRKEISLYNYYEIQVNRVLGVMIFPIIILIAFGISSVSITAVFISFPIIGTMLFIRYIKGFNIGFTYFGSHVIHFLLYICALEIAPVLIIIRLLLNIEPIRFPI